MALRRAWLLACRSMLQGQSPPQSVRLTAAEAFTVLDSRLTMSGQQLSSLREFHTSFVLHEAEQPQQVILLALTC